MGWGRGTLTFPTQVRLRIADRIKQEETIRDVWTRRAELLPAGVVVHETWPAFQEEARRHFARLARATEGRGAGFEAIPHDGDGAALRRLAAPATTGDAPHLTPLRRLLSAALRERLRQCSTEDRTIWRASWYEHENMMGHRLR